MSLNSTMTSAANGYREWVTGNPTRAEVCVALTGNPEVHGNACAGSANINAGNMFNSPDGIGFDNKGMPWIQTDGNYSNEKDFAGRGNNQMLVGDPVTGEIRPFPVGPKECETTGIAWPADRNPRSLASSIRARTATTASLTAARRSGITAVRAALTAPLPADADPEKAPAGYCRRGAIRAAE